jgi:hypothetical protein
MESVWVGDGVCLACEPQQVLTAEDFNMLLARIAQAVSAAVGGMVEVGKDYWKWASN